MTYVLFDALLTDKDANPLTCASTQEEAVKIANDYFKGDVADRVFIYKAIPVCKVTRVIDSYETPLGGEENGVED